MLDWIAALTNQPTSRVFERLRKEHWDLGSNVREALLSRRLEPFVWSAGLSHFYRDSDAFLYENIAFNRTRAKVRMRAWIGAFLASRFPDGARVLVYGDGAGFDSLYLAKAGHDVTYSEPGRLANAFARNLHAAEGQTVHLAAPGWTPSPESYDAILCLDVLEHLPEPPSTVLQLSRALRPHGVLIVHAPFFFLNRQCPTHLRSNLRFSGYCHALYGPAGLRAIGGRMFWDPIALERQSAERLSMSAAPPSATAHGRLWFGGLVLRLMQVCHRVPLRLVELALWRDRRELRRLFLRGGGV